MLSASISFFCTLKSSCAFQVKFKMKLILTFASAVLFCSIAFVRCAIPCLALILSGFSFAASETNFFISSSLACSFFWNLVFDCYYDIEHFWTCSSFFTLIASSVVLITARRRSISDIALSFWGLYCVIPFSMCLNWASIRSLVRLSWYYKVKYHKYCNMFVFQLLIAFSLLFHLFVLLLFCCQALLFVKTENL